MKILRILSFAAAAILAQCTPAFAQVYGPTANLNVPGSAPLKGDVTAGRDYSITGPVGSGYIYATPATIATSNTLTAFSGASNTAQTISLAAPASNKSWVITSVQYSFSGGSPTTVTKGVTTYTGATSTDFTTGDTVTIGAPGSGGNFVYRFQTTPTATNDVKLGGTSDTSVLNLARAINNSGGTAGTDYIVLAANPYVTSSATVTSHAITLTAIAPGTWANGIRTTQTVSNSATGWSGATLNSGTPATGPLFTIAETSTIGGVATVPNIVYALGFGTAPGTDKVLFLPPLKCTAATAVTLNLSAAGSSIYGVLSTQAFQQ